MSETVPYNKKNYMKYFCRHVYFCLIYVDFKFYNNQMRDSEDRI